MKPVRPRIVVLAPHFAEYSTRLAIGLSAHGPVLLVIDRDNRAAECEPSLLATAEASLSTLGYGSRSRLARRLAAVMVPARILLFRPDILHVQEQGDLLTAFFVNFLRKVMPIALTVHDPKPHSGKDADYAERKFKNLSLLRESASLFHVHGKYCLDILMAIQDRDKTFISTAHGVLMVALPDAQREPDPARFLLFGRMEAYKGIETLLDAADLLLRRGLRFQLVLAGSGPEIGRLSDRLKANHIVLLAKFLSPAEAIEQFQKASFVVAPYRDATQSGVVAAAFGNSRPVIATRSGGLVDAVIDDVNGLLVDSDSPGDLANAMERVLCDATLCRRLANGARESAQGSFSWGHISSVLVHSYLDLIKGRSI